MKSLVATARSEVRLTESPMPKLAAGHVLCRVAYLGLCGVDLSLSRGYSTYSTQGLKSYPFVLGHEWSGIVVEVADDVDPDVHGRAVAGHNFITCGVCVACRSNRQVNCSDRSEMGILGEYPGAASEYVVVPAVVLTPIPREMSLLTATLLEPASTALHALVRVSATATDRILVLGTGTLGLAVTLLARAMGCNVTVAGMESASRSLALELGANAAVDPANLERDAYDVVVEASGSTDAVKKSFETVAAGGRIAQIGVPNSVVDRMPFAELVIKNARLEAVLSRIHHWDPLVRLVVEREIDLDALIDRIYPIDKHASAFDALARQDRARPKVILAVGETERTLIQRNEWG